VSSLPKTATRQRRDCDLNSGPSATESSTLTTRLPSQPAGYINLRQIVRGVNACSVSRPAFPFLSRRTSSDVSLLFVVEQATCSSSTYITYRRRRRRRRRFNFAAVAHSAKSTARASFTQRNFPEFLRILAILTPPPIGERSTVMILYVCVFVSPRASYFRNFISDLQQIFCACYV